MEPSRAPHRNDLGQPVGTPLPDWRPPPAPCPRVLAGRYAWLERLDADRHADALFTAYRDDAEGRGWTYMPYGPFADTDELRSWLSGIEGGADPMFFAVGAEGEDAPAGLASYLRVAPAAGSLEIGHIHFAPCLQRTRSASEALYLLIAHAFRLGYRRVEWKCDSLNAASRRAATRLGFAYEGIFRQATVYKGRNRDTAWYAVIDAEWPVLQAAFERWLEPENFDGAGHQRRALAELIENAAVR